jgi:hypothetical protein
LDRAKDAKDFVRVRHEEDAAFMACGYARFTGEVGDVIKRPWKEKSGILFATLNLENYFLKLLIYKPYEG